MRRSRESSSELAPQVAYCCLQLCAAPSGITRVTSPKSRRGPRGWRVFADRLGRKAPKADLEPFAETDPRSRMRLEMTAKEYLQLRAVYDLCSIGVRPSRSCFLHNAEIGEQIVETYGVDNLTADR
ncbi:hypothetical protein D3C71_1629190 [compost metagenome]